MNSSKFLLYISATFFLGALVYAIASVTTGCTISFQNIDTHGMAADLVDENQNTNPNISPNIEVPVGPI